MVFAPSPPYTTVILHFCICLMKLLPAIVISSYMEERQSMRRLKSLKERGFGYMAANRSRFSKHLMIGSSIFSVNFTNRKILAKPSYPAERKGRFRSWAGLKKIQLIRISTKKVILFRLVRAGPCQIAVTSLSLTSSYYNV